MAQKKEVRKLHIYDGLGFPVALENCPMVKIRGQWTPDVDYNSVTEEMLKALPAKVARLTGNEVRFIRLMMGMTLDGFGKRFSVSHAAVKKWESTGNTPTMMAWATEKDIRFFVMMETDSTEATLKKLYEFLTREANRRRIRMRYDCKNATAYWPTAA